jgi:peptidoglycan-associated lipoprotein
VKLKLIVTLVAIASAGCASTPQGNDASTTTGAATAAPAANAQTAAAKPAATGSQLVQPVVADNLKTRSGAAAMARSNSVFFDYDKFEIKNQQAATVSDNAKYFAGQRDKKIVVEGHADERGSREYNLALGQKRAEAVKRALTAQGVSEARIESVSYGEERPRKDGHDEAAWAENRRGDILPR